MKKKKKKKNIQAENKIKLVEEIIENLFDKIFITPKSSGKTKANVKLSQAS